MSVFYVNLEKERIIHKENKSDVAKLIKTNYKSLAKKMNGISKWTIDDIETLCNHYDKDYYYLFDTAVLEGEQHEEMVNT